MVKMLVVDDSHLLQEKLLRTIMEVHSSTQVHQAYSCEEAVEWTALFKADVIILDIELPDGSGIDLLRKLRKDHQETTMIMFTNYPNAEFKRACMTSGADYFIDKSDYTGLVDALSDNLLINPNI
jgi:DNA-binding response OmpR family regulator